MFDDVTGIPLVPGNEGKYCLGNGKQKDVFGNLIDCCYDECDWFL